MNKLQNLFLMPCFDMTSCNKAKGSKAQNQGVKRTISIYTLLNENNSTIYLH